MTRPETNYTANIYLASGAVFKVHLPDDWRDHWIPPNEVVEPHEVGPHFAETFSRDAPARNTLVAIDWGQVVAITYRRPAEGGGRSPEITTRDVVRAMEAKGGEVPSVRALCDALACGHGAVREPLRVLETVGAVEHFNGPRRAIGYRLTGRGLPTETTAQGLSSTSVSHRDERPQRGEKAQVSPRF